MWNYRIVKTTDKVTKEDSFEIREVYYDTLGKPMGHCAVSVIGDSIKEIEGNMKMMAEALTKPAITFAK